MDGFLASPVGWGIANLMRKTSIFQCIINVPPDKGRFQEDKPKVRRTWDEALTLYLLGQLRQHRCSSTSIATVCMYVCMHTYSFNSGYHWRDEFLGEQITCLLVALKSTMGGEKHLFLNPVSKNYFCGFGLNHSTSWGLNFCPDTSEMLVFTSSERWRSDFGIVGNSSEFSSCRHLVFLTILIFLCRDLLYSN